MKKSKIILLSVSLISLIFLILSVNLRGRFSVSSFVLNGLPSTWTIESLLSSKTDKNIYAAGSYSIKREIQSLPYVSKVKVSIRNGVVKVDGAKVDDAILLSDGSRVAFITENGSFHLDEKDYLGLKESYLTVWTSESFLDSEKDGKKSFFSSFVPYLSSLGESSDLITKAEYDNNKPSIFSGSLTLTLTPLDSILIVEDLRMVVRLKEALEMIEKEYLASSERLSGEVKEYVLADSSLVVKR